MLPLKIAFVAFCLWFLVLMWAALFASPSHPSYDEPSLWVRLRRKMNRGN